MPNLTYLFIAEFTDGTSFYQTPEDISTLDPKRNCYYDLLQTGKTIRHFSLTNGTHHISVDLGTGIFAINGFPILLESDKLPCLPDKFNLIWYHQTIQNQNVTYNTKTADVLKREKLPEFREYFIGWQCIINGKNYQQKIGVA